MQEVVAGRRLQLTRKIPGGRLIHWWGMTLAHFQHAPEDPLTLEDVDYVLLSHNAVKSFDVLVNTLKPRAWIVDSSNRPDVIHTLTREAIAKNLNLHVTATSGAFEITL